MLALNERDCGRSISGLERRMTLSRRYRAPMLGLYIAASFAIAALAPARAQTPPEASADEKILAGLERARKDGEGLVIISAEWPGGSCSAPGIFVGRVVDGKLQKVLIPAMVPTFGGALRNVRPKGLAAGTWMLGSVSCGKTTLNGPYAKFEVVAGETVDAGMLRVEYARENFFAGSGTASMSVHPTSEARMAELKKAIPRVMARARKSHMVLIGPAVRKMERAWPKSTPGEAKEPGEMFQR